jgi:hypothetical protein
MVKSSRTVWAGVGLSCAEIIPHLASEVPRSGLLHVWGWGMLLVNADRLDRPSECSFGFCYLDASVLCLVGP